jgi:hypothetical protein
VFTEDYDEQWLRAYYYFSSAYDYQCELTGIWEETTDQIFNTWVTDTTANVHVHNYAGGFWTSDSNTLPKDRWVCVEAHVGVGTPGPVELYFDGALVASDTGDTTYGANPLHNIVVGVAWRDVDYDQEMVIYVDEVVADTSRVGCD